MFDVGGDFPFKDGNHLPMFKRRMLRTQILYRQRNASFTICFLDFIASLMCDSTPYDTVNDYQPACVIDEGSTAWFHGFTDVFIYSGTSVIWDDATGCKYVVTKCHDFMIGFDQSKVLSKI